MRKITIYFACLILSLFSSLQASIALDLEDPRWFWMDEQIEEEFRPFQESGIQLHMLNETIRKIPEIAFGNYLVRLQVIGGKVYGPEGNAKELLKKICSLYPVPNVDVILHEQDIIWNHWVLPGPVLATCKIKGTTEKMIHFPLQLWSQWADDMSKIVEDICEASPWESKIEKLFWRGNPNDADNYNNKADWIHLRRGKLCYLSNKFQEKIDAAFSGMQSWQVHTHLEPEFRQFFPIKQDSWETYLNHKYLIDLDGYVASTPGCAWKLLSNCLVFKHPSRFTLWFYKILVPGIHYIPVKDDLSDLLSRLAWVKDHDAIAQEIAENGRKLAKENLMAEHLFLYCYKVLLKYAQLQRFNPTK